MHLTQAYEDLFANDSDYAYVAARHAPSELACKFTLGLAKGGVNKDGKAIKRVCKLLGIKYTYKAISEYLNAPEAIEA